jgi:hypothetical protein
MQSRSRLAIGWVRRAWRELTDTGLRIFEDNPWLGREQGTSPTRQKERRQ